jgi:hypothetical protein
MALPGREQTFAFENCRDVLEKLSREVERYAELDQKGNDLDAMKDTAFNVAVTAWHLCDWVFNDMTEAQRDSLSIHSPTQMQEYARHECRALHICRQAATASKHWEVRRYRDPNVAIVVTAPPDPPDLGTESSAPPVYVLPRWHIYIIDGNKVHPAGEVFSRAEEFWCQIIYQNGIAQ